jgi:serine/threonine protein phosphatase PrpC
MSIDERHEVTLPEGIVRFRYSACSDRGRVRKVNEDSYLAAVPLFLVADGMGGHAFGDRASQTAVRVFADRFETDAAATPAQILETLRLANEAVIELTADEGPGGAISGTTLTALALVDLDGTGGDEGTGSRWMAFNVGDSRTYVWDGSELAQLSVDHSAVQELVDLGLITRREADRHPDRNIITRALGADSEVEADVWLLPIEGRHTFLLCSDGLTKELGDDQIARIMAAHAAEERSDGPAPVSVAERLVKAAVDAGGSDNVTVLVVESQLGDPPTGR